MPMDKLLEQIYAMDKSRMASCAQHLMVGGGTRGGPVLERGKGVRVWDTEGKEYIDCTSQGSLPGVLPRRHQPRDPRTH